MRCWSLKKAGSVCDKLCWWPLNFSTLHNYTCIKIDKFIFPKSEEISQNLNSTPASLDMGGDPPHTDTLIGPAACGRCPKPNSLKRRASARALSLSWPSWTWLDSLELCGTPRSYASRFRNCALQRAPVRWTLTVEPTIGRSLRPCQSRNGATKSTTAEESFPRWRHAAVSSLHTRATEGARTATGQHRNKGTDTHAGKRSQNIHPA